MSTVIILDICTPEGPTWLARISSDGGEITRELLFADDMTTSRSGRTGSATFIVGDGLFASHEGRKRLGRRYWRVTGGEVAEISLDELTEEL